MELTVVMPCLNEAETVATCVRKAIGFLASSGISAGRGASEPSDQVRRADGARDVASGITLKPYPPVLG